ncbi:MAG: 50S ribosomal protein L11 methyltransferase [Tannerellaceae bacterium]|jgi:ribosomal protein L11 methyltransferase|nr:50S ribosomal protein L11 methyltransferase [Tannerellaceae bacterium]
MDFYELRFVYDSPVETEIINDILASELGEIGFESFTQAEDGLLAYIRETAYNRDELQQTIASFPLENTGIQFTENRMESKNWNEEWEKNYFKPITIGNDCIIHASFHGVEAGYAYDIVIDPKMSFGTGNHETTYLMIDEMLRMDFKGKEVLDMGCGTAVLAILAAQKEAGRVVGVDIDEWAYENALENIKLNRTTDIRIVLGGAEKLDSFDKFDIILANINRNILLRDAAYYANCMKKDGCLLMSGFYTEDIPVIEEAYKKQGLVLESFSGKNNWAVVKMQYPPT